MSGFNEERVSQKIIVIMTDGENHEGDPIGAARQAAEQGAVIYTVGFGSPEGEPIPEYDAQGNVVGYQEDGQGRAIISSTGRGHAAGDRPRGRRASISAPRIGEPSPALVDEIQSFQDDEPPERVQPYKQIERFQIFLLAGILSLVLAEVMTDRFSFIAVETAYDALRRPCACLIAEFCTESHPFVLSLSMHEL